MTDVLQSPRETARKRPYQPERGTRQIRRRIPGFGALRIASGVYSDADYRRVDDAILAVGAAGRFDWLRAIETGERKPVELVNALREANGRADQLPETSTAPFTRESVDAWLLQTKHRYADTTREVYARYLRPLTEATKRLTELPEVLRAEKKRLCTEGKFETFRHELVAIRAYLKDNLGETHPVYLQVKAIKRPTKKEIRNAPRRLTKKHLSIREALTVYEGLPPIYQGPWLTMLLTGCNPFELWSPEQGLSRHISGHIHIAGGKATGRERVVPRVTLTWRGKTYTASLERPLCQARAMEKFLRDSRKGVAKMYDARRSYSVFLALSRLPGLSQVIYMGHSSSAESQTYEYQDSPAYRAEILAPDAAQLQAWLQSQLVEAEEVGEAVA